MRAFKELSQFGKEGEGVDALILSLEYPPTTTLSARDLMDSISETLWSWASDNSDYLIDSMLEG